MNKLTVLFTTIELSLKTQSGSGIYAAELVKSLSNIGVKVVVIAPGAKEKKEVINKNLIIYWIKIIDKPLLKVPSFYFKVYRRVQHIIKTEKIDIIHNNEYSGLTILGRKPSLTTIHHPAFKDFKNYSLINKVFNLFDQLFEKRVINKSDLIVLDSHLTYSILIKNLKSRKKLHIINPGVDVSLFRYNSKSKIRKLNNISKKEILFFMPGGARSKRKGSLYLFDALSKINSEFKYKCIISGDSREVGWKKSFSEGILKNQIEENIILPGEIPYDSLVDYYSAADIVLFPSTFEGFGIPTLEALACNKPIIVTKTGEAGYIVKNRENGILIQPENSLELYSSIIELASNKKLRNKLIANSRKSVIDKYDWNVVSKEVLKLYKVLSRI